MGALFAYLVSIVVFVGGGYAGLYVLAHSDEFHQEQAKPLKHTGREARRAPASAVAPSTTIAKSALEPPIVESENQPASAGTTIAPAETEAKTAGTEAKTPDAAVTPPAAEVAAANTSPAEPSKNTSSSAPDAAPVAAADDAHGVTGNKSLTAVGEAHAEMNEASNSPQENAPQDETGIADHAGVELPIEQAAPARKQESGAAPKKEKADKSASRQATRPAQRTHTAHTQRKLVKMVMRTIEFPDGHREVRLISPGRAGSMSAYESDSDDLF